MEKFHDVVEVYSVPDCCLFRMWLHGRFVHNHFRITNMKYHFRITNTNQKETHDSIRPVWLAQSNNTPLPPSLHVNALRTHIPIGWPSHYVTLSLATTTNSRRDVRSAISVPDWQTSHRVTLLPLILIGWPSHYVTLSLATTTNSRRDALPSLFLIG